MFRRFAAILLGGMAAVALNASAQNDAPTKAQIGQIVKSLQYQHGEIQIKDGLATLSVPDRTLGLDAVAGMSELAEIENQTPDILKMVDFDQGNRYADFDPHVDKVAKYGIATLVAGGALGVDAKLGLFKLIWVFILGAKKLIIIGLAAIAAFFKKIFKGRSQNTP